MERKHKLCPRTPGVVLSEVEIIRKRIKKSERRLVGTQGTIEVTPKTLERVKHEMDVLFRLINKLEALGVN